MTKRQKFVLSSLLLLGAFFSAQFLDFSYRYYAIAALGFFSLVLSAWALKDGLERNATLLVLILPAFFTVGAQIFYLGLDSSNFPKILFFPEEYTIYAIKALMHLIYVVGMYAIFLTANIYTVAAARTIQLLRSAHAVGFVLTLVTGFLLFNTVWSLRQPFWINGLSVGLISFLLLLQGFWLIELEEKISRELLGLSLGTALVITEITTMLSFWPVTVSVASLAVTTAVYVLLGLGQAKLQQRLFAKTVKEYLFIGGVVATTMFFTARWGG